MSDAEAIYDNLNEANDVDDDEPLVEDQELTGNESGKFLIFKRFIIFNNSICLFILFR